MLFRSEPGHKELESEAVSGETRPAAMRFRSGLLLGLVVAGAVLVLCLRFQSQPRPPNWTPRPIPRPASVNRVPQRRPEPPRERISDRSPEPAALRDIEWDFTPAPGIHP